jgi:hypothetical protein
LESDAALVSVRRSSLLVLMVGSGGVGLAG